MGLAICIWDRDTGCASEMDPDSVLNGEGEISRAVWGVGP